MGQYYRPVTEFNNKVTVYNRYVDGEYTMAKLMEHSWWENDLMKAIAQKFYHTKGKLAWVGDYANDDETPVPMKEIWEDTDGVGVSKVDFSLDNKFLINYDKKLYVDLKTYKEECNVDGWVVNPLSLLTAIGNGRGGGDYHYSSCPCIELVGTWAWDTISIEDKLPKGFNKLDVKFIDQ